MTGRSLRIAVITSALFVFVGTAADHAQAGKSAKRSLRAQKGPAKIQSKAARSKSQVRPGSKTPSNQLARSKKTQRNAHQMRKSPTQSMGDPATTRLAGGPLKSGTYRVTRDNSHKHLSGPLQSRPNDTVFTVKDGHVTMGPNSGVISGMKIQLKPEVRYIKNKPETIGWVGTGSRYNPNNMTTDKVTVRISGHAYRSAHPGLRDVSIQHEATQGFRRLSLVKSGGASWRTSGD